MTATFTDREKLAAITREIALRRSVYKVRVAQEKMAPEDAERETNVMLAIAEDYRQRIESNEGLFPRAGH